MIRPAQAKTKERQASAVQRITNEPGPNATATIEDPLLAQAFRLCPFFTNKNQ